MMYGKCFQTHSCKRLHYILLIIIDHGENTLDNHCYRAYAKKKDEDHNYNGKNWHSSYLTVQLISSESVTCEASAQGTHLTILAEVLRHSILLAVDVLHTTCIFLGPDLRVLKIISSEYGLSFQVLSGESQV